MMEGIRQWIVSVTCAAMVAALCQAFFSRSGAGRAGRLAAGALVMLAAVRPFLKWDHVEPERALREYSAVRSQYVQQLEQQNGTLMKAVIERESAAYILDKADEWGFSCRAEVVCSADGSGRFRPTEVIISGELTGQEMQRLGQVLEVELGVPPERQIFTHEEVR